MPYDEKAKVRTMRYMKEKRDKLTLNLPIGDKDRYKEHAKQRNKSLTGLIVDLIEQDIEALQQEENQTDSNQISEENAEQE